MTGLADLVYLEEKRNLDYYYILPVIPWDVGLRMIRSGTSQKVYLKQRNKKVDSSTEAFYSKNNNLYANRRAEWIAIARGRIGRSGDSRLTPHHTPKLPDA